MNLFRIKLKGIGNQCPFHIQRNPQSKQNSLFWFLEYNTVMSEKMTSVQNQAIFISEAKMIAIMFLILTVVWTNGQSNTNIQLKNCKNYINKTK